ncbi:sulfoxide reductase heme-binding subunit YedZ [mine drainage metagenome]|uniref:Sulfoxide reductase heme-binding subunit YedZ n=1 Tax=mine drainage metagenome TaxID=410659 RepID=A0A1J5TCY7_9ZZZZ
MQTIELSGTLGLIATVILTFNVLLGMMLSSSFKNKKWWQRFPEKIKTINITDLHNYTAYIALVIVLAHIVLIPLDAASKFNVIDMIWPLHAPHQSNIVLLGTISLLALIAVIITTQKVIKRKMSFRIWKNIHLVSYATCMLFIVHGLLMDPELKDRPTDWFDAEKLLSEICGIVLITAFAIRYNYHLSITKK